MDLISEVVSKARRSSMGLSLEDAEVLAEKFQEVSLPQYAFIRPLNPLVVRPRKFALSTIPPYSTRGSDSMSTPSSLASSPM